MCHCWMENFSNATDEIKKTLLDQEYLDTLQILMGFEEA